MSARSVSFSEWKKRGWCRLYSKEQNLGISHSLTGQMLDGPNTRQNRANNVLVLLWFLLSASPASSFYIWANFLCLSHFSHFSWKFFSPFKLCLRCSFLKPSVFLMTLSPFSNVSPVNISRFASQFPSDYLTSFPSPWLSSVLLLSSS